MVVPGRGGVEVVYSWHAWPQSYNNRRSHPYDDGTEHVGFSPTRAGAILFFFSGARTVSRHLDTSGCALVLGSHTQDNLREQFDERA